MDAVNTGGPAFPRAAFEGETGFSKGQKGMTLRDYFAAKAMQAEISRHSYGIEDAARDVADAAYEYADAMLAAREVSVPDGGWIEWAGGDCPVVSDTRVEIKYPDDSTDVNEAYKYRWDWKFGGLDGGDIVAYRIVTP